MAKTKRRKNLPSVYLDQHIDRDLAAVFRPLFRTVEVSQTASLCGRDEADYLPELYADNGIFVTSDEAFVRRVLDDELRHAGIVFIPTQMKKSEKLLFAEIVCGFLQGACSNSRFALRNQVIYPANDGLRSIAGGKDELEFSWDWLSRVAELTP
jgi:hypothetical protein